MLTGKQVFVVALVIALVAIVCFTIGLLCRRASDAELIDELETELQARQVEMPPEIAHEPSPGEMRMTGRAIYRQDLAAVEMPRALADTPHRGFVALRGNELADSVIVMCAELESWTTRLIKDAETAA